ncbi:MAG: methylmalonyl Co-A mutase-associated GTPase MeaB [Candidatus Eisenbacteria bacterium]|nr:methylmalonyl Co-A mutase-associated GTPase MeaB [Candidatus Eisenbacteria bacterium]MCC7143927.1 methylmalonyl Co-A mutase-associated GTPase MeaB [Candidatus Eisenbacteria bacterium]
MRMDVEAAVAGVRNGDKRALARTLSMIEDESAEGRTVLDRLYPFTGQAYKVGITGPPGSGKSTLTDLLCRLLRARGETVGILAVDPSSPFSGGAILGDRIRMQTLAGDPGVYMRSMASRGSLGGLAAATQQATEALDAFGCHWILIETVGVGQSEMEVVGVADTTLLVLVPESGDGVQIMKAGLMEAGEIYVINKYDREGGDRIEKEIHLLLGVLHERMPEGAWFPPIVPTVGIRDEGGEALLAAIERHRAFLTTDPERARGRREERARDALRTLLRARLLEQAWGHLRIEERFDQRLPEVVRREISPYRLVDSLLSEVWDRMERGAS